VRDEGLDLSSAGIAKDRGSAIISGIGLHEARIEAVLADQEAELVAKPRLTIRMAVVSTRGKSALTWLIRAWRTRRPSEFLNGAETNAICFTERAIHGARFSDAHFGTVDKGRDIRWISVSVADKAARAGRLIDDCLKDPPTPSGVTKALFDDRLDSCAFSPFRYSKETRMSNVPSTIEEAELAGRHI
jgi:hypothetical protein